MAVHPEIHLDRSSAVPLYFQVAEQLEQAIRDGDLAPGARMDNEIAMAQQLGLSRPTMRQAIQVLVDKGLLVRKRGVGTRVVQSRIRRAVELTSLHDDLTRIGRRPTTRVLGLELVAASEEACAQLGVSPSAKVWSVERLRLVEDEPRALMHNVVPADLVDLGAVHRGRRGLYEALPDAGVRMRVANQEIGARRDGARDARLLGEREARRCSRCDARRTTTRARAVELRHPHVPARPLLLPAHPGRAVRPMGSQRLSR